ncbi:MAG: class I SAM-dependent methyltransferase [Candidatus Helarchaeota archaeon]
MNNIFQYGDYHLNLEPPIHVVRCPKCSLTFLSPRPGKDLRKSLMNGIVPQPLRAYDKKSANYNEVNKSRYKIFENRIELIKNRANVDPASHNRIKILDIGASGGAFLRVARKKDLIPFGIEPSNACFINGHKNINLVQSLSENIPFPANTFDIVHANHVFEHFSNPLRSAYEVNRVLKPGGLIFIEVPNQFDNVMFLRDKLFNRIPQRKRTIRSIHHFYFFSKKTIRRLLQSARFDQISIHDFYSWKSRSWRLPFSLATRAFGLIRGGGDRIQAWGYKRKHS